MRKISLLLLPAILLTACGAPIDPAREVGGGAIDNAGCKNADSEFWNSLYKTAENGLALPDPDRVEQEILREGDKRNFKKVALRRYAKEFSQKYRVVFETVKTEGLPGDRNKIIEALVALETGDREGEKLSAAQDTISALRSRVSAAEAGLDAVCEPKKPADPSEPSTPIDPSTPDAPSTPPIVSAPDGELFEQLRSSLAPEVFGGRKTITTAYQSCEALSLKPIDDSVPDVRGIIKTGRHPSGGNIREISSLSNVQKTHYYLAHARPETGTSCFNVMKSPLIYDFGGKPYASTAKPSLLNLFKDHGTGSSVLGVDCSGYIFTALAMAGLKLDPSTEMKAIQVSNIPARRYMKPSNGMRCFEAPKMTSSLAIAPGDIAATSGHIVMVDSVGPDPLGLARARSAADCTESKLSSSGFDFVISQSNPSKEGIGINRMVFRDYAKESPNFKDGFQKMAVAACKAKFGSATRPASSNMALVRHKKTAECRTKPFTLQNESCLYSCPRI